MSRGTGIGFVILTLEFEKEDGYWLGHCRELGTATDGRSLSAVMRRLNKLVALHLDGLEAIGERENLFRERGITLYADGLPSEVPTSVPVTSNETLVQATSVAV